VNAADYSAVERLRDGRQVEIRALRPADRAGLLAAMERTSDESRYRRFFAPKRTFSEQEIEYYLNVDFVSHVALVAELDQNGRPVIAGGGRYIVSAPGRAEVAFAVDDPHQGLGIATRLMRHLVAIAREAGLNELVAEVLAENAPMLKVFERSGLPVALRREAGVVHVTLDRRAEAPGEGASDQGRICLCPSRGLLSDGLSRLG
jgi:RimJ/RimL family protein N-acetyltransferase